VNKYKQRHIRFKEYLSVEDWQLKVYTISENEDYDFAPFYEKVKTKLSTWLELENGFNSKHYNIGFLILHAASEGVFSILNWWLDGYMINTNVFLSAHNDPSDIMKISGAGLGPCVWELEVINFERVAWTNHVLKKLPKPDFETYLASIISKTL
jgi:hypothetical protein